LNEFFIIILFALLPALGTFAGGTIAEFFKISKQTYSLALHAVTGIIFAVISVVLIPQALKASVPWIVVLAFVLGGVFFITIDRLINFVQGRFATDQSAAAWAIFSGVAIDSFTDGLMIGTGSFFNKYPTWVFCSIRGGFSRYSRRFRNNCGL